MPRAVPPEKIWVSAVERERRAERQDERRARGRTATSRPLTAPNAAPTASGSGSASRRCRVAAHQHRAEHGR